ncbi:unnamed protein product [Adineta steineri]|uniref:N-acetyltransferase domain-containing protein n=1 Tax=Adineta steineri TaxID=433720 RepID=A0A820AAW4_9BILA|nr:unnamed protein product [Adineta steineri]CAF4182720.1 unnamed protein product [Adineta steineri]
MTAVIDYRPVNDNEQQQAISLWEQIFPQFPSGFFPRYYSSAAPSYQFGDTLGAWCNGSLVSTVHIHRLPLCNGNETYVCGGIACVATLPEYRERGISRYLLGQAIDKMKNEGYHISMLNSLRHSHYLYIGFQHCSFSRQLVIDLNENTDDASISPNCNWKMAQVDEEIINIYSKQPRPFQLNRSREHFKGWVNWNWQQDKAIVYVIPEEGYIVLSKNNDDGVCLVSEWQAKNREIEEQLLVRASYKAQQLNSKQIRLAATPIFVDQRWIEKNLGRIVTIVEDDTTMIRNINLTMDQFQKLTTSYITGEAIMWPADYF